MCVRPWRVLAPGPRNGRQEGPKNVLVQCSQAVRNCAHDLSLRVADAGLSQLLEANLGYKGVAMLPELKQALGGATRGQFGAVCGGFRS